MPKAPMALACPWCGSTELDWKEDGDGPLYAIGCKSCWCEGPYKESKQEAVAAWDDGPVHDFQERRKLRADDLQAQAAALEAKAAEYRRLAAETSEATPSEAFSG